MDLDFAFGSAVVIEDDQKQVATAGYIDPAFEFDAPHFSTFDERYVCRPAPFDHTS
jgi:hypothetical protein